MSHAEEAAPLFRLPEEIEAYRELARRIVREELLPLEPEYLAHPGKAHSYRARDALRAVFAPATVKRLYEVSHDTGLWGLAVPEAHGGIGAGLLARSVVAEELYYTAVPFPMADVPNILYHCTGGQVAKYLQPCIEGRFVGAFAMTEPDAGSDPGGMARTAAVRDGDDWVINGTKMWISNADVGDFIMVLAVTDPAKRQRGGFTMFLVDRDNPGLNVVTPGIRTWLDDATSEHIVHFDDCRVPQSAMLGAVGGGFQVSQEWLTVTDRLLRVPFCVGKMQRALDMSIDWAKQRVTFGQALAERQAIQWKLVDMQISIRMLRSLLYEVAARADAGGDIRGDAGMLKLCATDWGVKAIDDAMQIHGAMGHSLELPLTLFYRYIRHAQVGGGANEVHRMTIARDLLRRR